MHILGFVLGMATVAAGVAAICVGMGLSGWAVFALATGSFVIGQLLYLAWVAAMAWSEARRRKRQDQDMDKISTKTTSNAVQKD